jgi:rod shape-determining protein MreD
VRPPAWSRRALVLLAVGLVALAILQVSVVNFLPMPWAVPDLVVVTVLAVAIARGPLTGGLVGAWAGLVLDLIPPATGPLGAWMLVLAVAGAVLGRVAQTYGPGPFTAMALLAAAGGAVVLARAAVLWFAGSGVDVSVLGAVVASMAWALVLAPLALVLVTRSTNPAPSARVRVTSTGGLGSSGGAGRHD